MDSLKDLMKQKANDMDVDGHQADLMLAERVIKRHISGEGVRVEKITEAHVLIVLVASSSIASELRMQSVSILHSLNEGADRPKVERIITRVSHSVANQA